MANFQLVECGSFVAKHDVVEVLGPGRAVAAVDRFDLTSEFFDLSNEDDSIVETRATTSLWYDSGEEETDEDYVDDYTLDSSGFFITRDEFLDDWSDPYDDDEVKKQEIAMKWNAPPVHIVDVMNPDGRLNCPITRSMPGMHTMLECNCSGPVRNWNPELGEHSKCAACIQFHKMCAMGN